MEKTKFFLDIDKEEKWLNEMTQDGKYRFTKKSGFTYYFTENATGTTYHYLVDQRLFSKNNQQFCDFLADMNLTLVTRQCGWYYFETTDPDSAVSIYTDSLSKIKYYIRMIGVLFILMLFNISIIQKGNDNGALFFNISFPMAVNVIILICCLITTGKYLYRILILKKS
ncbi:MAG: DUF2812 domain-containing protein [Clostridia bacterium]|nr:DUF2812 domain-containing protein [Clostridia bacterium]NCC43190.1 DUF2812 domain-containing protein [Clostridia bacterium]